MKSGNLWVGILCLLAFGACSLDDHRSKSTETSTASERNSERSEEPKVSAAERENEERPVAVKVRAPRRDDAPYGPKETRATWVVSYSMKTADSIWDFCDEAYEARANTVFVQVRARGDAYYQSELEPRAAGISPGLDPLKEVLAAAGTDLEVHAWVNCALVAGAEERPSDPRHIVNRHPEWLAVPEPIAAELRKYSPTNPTYLQKLRDYASKNRGTVEGLFVDLAIPDVRMHIANVVGDIARRYPLRGIHLDYIRYANAKFGYSKAALDEFRRVVDAELPAYERREMAKRIETDPFTYTKRFKQRFARFRREAVTETVRECREAADRARAGLLFSAAVLPDIEDARDQNFQDWSEWLKTAVVDVACPMIYSQRDSLFEQQSRAAIAASSKGVVWPGIGAWLLTPAEINRRILFCRRQGAPGIAFFSHQGLKDVGAFSPLRSGPFTTRAQPK